MKSNFAEKLFYYSSYELIELCVTLEVYRKSKFLLYQYSHYGNYNHMYYNSNDIIL